LARLPDEREPAGAAPGVRPRLPAQPGQKESKSLGNVTDPIALAETFGVDAVRYFFMREVAFGQDGSWSPEAIVTRCNAELANSYGNLVQRVLSMIFKNMDGKLGPFRASRRMTRCWRTFMTPVRSNCPANSHP
jgi:methionyl-tRNA synthetase